MRSFADARLAFAKIAVTAIAKATAGAVSGALDSLRQSDSSVYVDAYMVDIMERTAQRGDVFTALSLIKHISAERRPVLGAEALEKIARAQTLRGDSDGAIKWARTQTDSRFRASALFGVLQGSLEKCKPGSTNLED